MTRVLVVDDEPPIRLLVRVNLEAEGMEVIEAADGLTAVEVAKRERPDLILLNVAIPALDGWAVAEEVGTAPETREIPIVFLTGRATVRDHVRAYELGAVDYITKPFNGAELASRFRAVLERLDRGERDELRREKLAELEGLGDEDSFYSY